MPNKENDVLSSSVENETKRRGRPKKTVQSSEISAENNQALEASVEAPKKRGRKPKASTEELSLFDTAQPTTTTAETAENASKTKRGRPAKAKQENSKTETSMESQSEQSLVEETANAKPAKNRTNIRSRKNIQATQNERDTEDNISVVVDDSRNSSENNVDMQERNSANSNYYNNQLNQENDFSKRRPHKSRNDNRNGRQKYNQTQFSNDNGQNNYGAEQSYNQNNFDYSYNKPNNQRSRNQKNFSQKSRNTKQVNPAYNDVAFDNSSIIAAITGKNIQQDFNMFYDDNNISFEQVQGQNQKNYDNRNKQRNSNSRNKSNQRRGRNSQFSPQGPIPEFQSDDSLISQFKSYGANSTQQLNAQYIDENVQQVQENNFVSEPVAYVENKKSKPAPNEEVVNETKALNVREQRNTHSAAEELHAQPQKSNYSQNLKMYIGVQPDEQIEIALADNKVVVEYFVEMSHQAKIRGNIYKGVIHNVDPNLQAVFVNFGAERNGFLQIDEVHPDYYLTPHTANKTHKFPLISKVLRPGQEILVQIVKEPTGTKGAFLTTWISLAGRYLVLTPGQEQIGVSRKVADHEERGRLRELLEGIDPGEDMGIIIRTAAANATREDIEDDLEYLQDLWMSIVERANESPALSLIHQEVDLAERVMRDYLTENIKEIWTDDPDMADRMNTITGQVYPQKRKMVKYHSDTRQSLWERFNLQTQIDEITSREVSLPSGGRVAFDQTEALMAIDINSGKTQNKASFHSMVLQTNIEAAQAIARHLRLRDIGGQIVIDFIELRDKSAVREVEKAFHEAMKPDRARYEIGSISPFGLLEIVRQRIGSSAISISSEPCPHCKGTGVRRNMEWQAQDALKEIARKARAEKTIKYTHVAEKELALYLLNTKRDRIQEIEEQLSKRIEIVI